MKELRELRLSERGCPRFRRSLLKRNIDANKTRTWPAVYQHLDRLWQSPLRIELKNEMWQKWAEDIGLRWYVRVKQTILHCQPHFSLNFNTFFNYLCHLWETCEPPWVPISSNIKRLLIFILKHCYIKIKLNVCACLIHNGYKLSSPYLPYLWWPGENGRQSLTHHLSPSTMYKMPSSWKAKCISLNSQLKSLLTWSHCLITAQAHSKFHLSSSLSLSQEYQSSIVSSSFLYHSCVSKYHANKDILFLLT